MIAAGRAAAEIGEIRHIVDIDEDDSAVIALIENYNVVI